MSSAHSDHSQNDPHRHHPAGHHHHPHGPDADAETLASVLDLDAAVCGDYLTRVPDRIADLVPAPIRILDLGCGTGVGTVALARRFPDAEIIAVDASSDMIERTRTRATHAEVDTRVRTVVADLDTALPDDIGTIDAAWSSSTLHHFADPKSLLRSTFDALRPGGVLSVIEIATPPTFLPPGSDDAAVERRIQPTASDGGWHGHLDWAGTISAAGFDVVDTLDIVTDRGETGSPTAEYAIAWWSRLRSFRAESMTADDLTRLDALLSDDDPSSLRHRDDLHVRARRTAWIARRPE